MDIYLLRNSVNSGMEFYMDENIVLYNSLNNDTTDTLIDVVEDNMKNKLFITKKRFLLKSKNQCSEFNYDSIKGLKAKLYINKIAAIIVLAIAALAVCGISLYYNERLDYLEEVEDEKRDEYRAAKNNYDAFVSNCPKDVGKAMEFFVANEAILNRLDEAINSAEGEMNRAGYDCSHTERDEDNYKRMVIIGAVAILLVMLRRKLVIIEKNGKKSVILNLGWKKSDILQQLQQHMENGLKS